MLKPAGLPANIGAATLMPIEPRSAREPKKMKTPWSATIHYLQDLRAKKTQLF